MNRAMKRASSLLIPLLMFAVGDAAYARKDPCMKKGCLSIPQFPGCPGHGKKIEYNNYSRNGKGFLFSLPSPDFIKNKCRNPEYKKLCKEIGDISFSYLDCYVDLAENNRVAR